MTNVPPLDSYADLWRPAFTMFFHYVVLAIDETFRSVMNLRRRIRTPNTDFQMMFNSAYTVKLYRESGVVGDPPLQAPIRGLALLVPSPFLPFDDIDPSAWFSDSIGATPSAMFGIRTQPVIGGSIQLLRHQWQEDGTT
jgi:hypothetical protein